MPRFVILRHEMPREHERPSHWDLMFECGEALRTWATEAEPGSAGAIAARRLPDHRPAYLDYEGPVPGDRGSVTRWDEGSYEAIGDNEQPWTLLVRGKRLSGRLTFERTGHDDHSWRVSFAASPTSG